MPDPTLILIAFVFAVAGFVKGVVGLGLPTVSMGLLSVVMPSAEAAAILILPSFLTNVWQMAGGPSLRAAALRLWPMIAAVCLGTWAGSGLMTGPYARYGGAGLGVALIVYAAMGLAAIRFSIRPDREKVVGPLAGGVTGLIAAITGVFVIPAVPYLQAIGLEKEELVQALGLSFTVSTLALAVNVAAAGRFNAGMAEQTLAALVLACVGMWAGQAVRRRVDAETFRRWFFGALLVLGVYLIFNAAA